MKNYIVNCDKMKFFKTFKSFESIIEFLTELNQKSFDGSNFSYFGRGYEIDSEGNYIDLPYFVDSVVLCPKNNRNDYYTFFIRCINNEGEIIELN